jgi:hypothetical protein
MTQLSHRSLVNCISDDKQAKYTEPHTADTQITDSADFKISAVVSILQYSATSVICLISAL